MTQTMNKTGFLVIARAMDDCLKSNAHIDSEAAFRLIRGIALLAAKRGQRGPAYSVGAVADVDGGVAVPQSGPSHHQIERSPSGPHQ